MMTEEMFELQLTRFTTMHHFSKDAVYVFRNADDCGDQKISAAKPHVIAAHFEEGEDWFSFWEKCRSFAEDMLIIRERGTRNQGADSDIAPFEVCEWSGKTVELSVILPVYNVAEYLPGCIERLIRQEAPYTEFIFVNDGSTDTSAQIIEMYARKDKRIRLINKENGGCASARNAGIAEAHGNYIGFVDPDDFTDPLMFRKLLSRAMMGNYDLAYCGYNEYAEDTGKVRKVMNDCLTEPYLSGTVRSDRVQLLIVNTRVAIWRMIIRRDALERKGIRFYEDMKRFDDLPFRVEAILAARSAVCVPEYLYYYRINRAGQDTSCRDERLFVHFLMFDHLEKFAKTYKDRRILDLMQIVMLQTHGYALSHIENCYRSVYIRKARRQMNRNCGVMRTIILTFLYGGRGQLSWYIAMELLRR